MGILLPLYVNFTSIGVLISAYKIHYGTENLHIKRTSLALDSVLGIFSKLHYTNLFSYFLVIVLSLLSLNLN